MLLELAAMCYRGCNLIVAGRIDEDRTFRTMSDVTLPDGLDTLVRSLGSQPMSDVIFPDGVDMLACSLSSQSLPQATLAAIPLTKGHSRMSRL